MLNKCMASFTLASTLKGDDNVLGESWDSQPALKLLHSEPGMLQAATTQQLDRRRTTLLPMLLD